MTAPRMLIVILFSVIGSKVTDCHEVGWDYRDT